MLHSSPELGVLALLDHLRGTALTRYAQDIEFLGFGSFWLPELFGREPMVTAAHLLAHTGSLVLATGIANVYVRDAHALAQAAQTLGEFSGGRFILGLGVSNVGLNTAARVKLVAA